MNKNQTECATQKEKQGLDTAECWDGPLGGEGPQRAGQRERPGQTREPTPTASQSVVQYV